MWKTEIKDCSLPLHFLSVILECSAVHANSLQSCPTLCDPMDCSLPISSVHGILRARILKWVAVPSSRGSSQPGDPAHISYISALAGGFFTSSTTCCCSLPQSCTTICDPMDCSTLCSLVLPISWSFLKLMYIESVMPSNHFILCLPLFLPSIFPSIRAFSNELALHIRWPKYWNFSFKSVLPMNIQDLFPLGLTGWISLQSKGLSRVFSNTTIPKHLFFSAQLSL